MTLNKPPTASASGDGDGLRSSIVANGRSNLVAAFESQARQIVEAKYAEEWSSAGLIRRWRLRRIMNLEIRVLAARLMPEVSPDALF
jgi:hypothetical protein